MGLKEGVYVKKIVKAWVQQIIEFDSEEEYNKNSKHDAYYSYNFTDYSPGEYNSAIGIKFDKYAINRV